MNEKEILRRTSRSFHLTIRLLPRAVRDDISLAYLLARATDTMADTATAPEGERLHWLRALRESLGRAEIAGYDAAAWAGQHREAAERSLLLALPDLWRRMGERRDKKSGGEATVDGEGRRGAKGANKAGTRRVARARGTAREAPASNAARAS
jgi:phytoene/squalene synthetase